MNSTLIKSVVEEKVKTSENEFENQVKITFNTTDNNSTDNTITLSGQGSLKVLMPV